MSEGQRWFMHPNKQASLRTHYAFYGEDSLARRLAGAPCLHGASQGRGQEVHGKTDSISASH